MLILFPTYVNIQLSNIHLPLVCTTKGDLTLMRYLKYCVHYMAVETIVYPPREIWNEVAKVAQPALVESTIYGYIALVRSVS